MRSTRWAMLRAPYRNSAAATNRSRPSGTRRSDFPKRFRNRITVMQILSARRSFSNLGSPSEGISITPPLMRDKRSTILLGCCPSAAGAPARMLRASRSEEHTSELQSPYDLVCRLLLEKKNKILSSSGAATSLIRHAITRTIASLGSRLIHSLLSDSPSQQYDPTQSPAHI